ncbi:MAG: T9SS type A sorting domain-containing protein [Saprospiraceae bacterium]|nr:T9SS type A sorting domain-containing protein [Saprospiraceae bacterium]MCF8252736.1 T9SS type A sorting domain-containing protein [Saprospiraceae bacterium]MCF8282784.1 T9SS type A sorting domain-containing protein [Bacteroidales bacterium]MCF8313330.1 T9SS type A sorting domain-containing protein [Saprospiraceae bacterium]MCF8441714.1 T9SS type A sorting domain-containing protein [Saprospiraceae bacterium]
MKKTITPVFQNRAFFRSLTKTSVFKSAFKHLFLQGSLMLLSVSAATTLNAQCSMACSNSTNVSLPATCQGTILYNMILQNPTNCSPNGPSAFEVTVMNLNNAPIPTSPVVNATHIGQTLIAKVKHTASGNSCWGYINIEDKLAPTLTCPANVVVACTAPTTPASTGTATATDCSDFTISHTSQTQVLGCAGTNYTAIITRTWMAVDLGGYVSSCAQTINILKPTVADITWPPHLDGFGAPMLDCVNPNTTPANTGAPSIGGFPIPNGTGYCNMAVTYSDQTIPLCQASYKILRTWTVVSWCTSTIQTHVQIIAVKDTHPPTLTCPADLTAGTTSATQCKATVILPPVGISDDCSTSFTVTMNTPVGQVNGNGGVINNVSVGVYNITYNVTDGCGNLATCTMKLTVVDDDSPTMICVSYTTVTLNSNGMALVYPNTFNNGSYDNCSNVAFTVRRMTAACGTQPIYGPSVKFCCDDSGSDVTVQMQGTDASGNTNSCMVTVHVTDNSQPAIICPANLTINCTQDPNDLSLTGTATASAACGTPVVTHTDVTNLNMCNVGSVVRTWKATLGNGNVSTCVQTINLVDNTPANIVFPPDYAVSGCVSLNDLIPSNLPAPYNAPVTTSDCELLATNFTDQVFTVSGPACFKIVRTWKVINWCTYVPGGNTGIWEKAQIIMVTDNQAPTFTCPSNMVVAVGANCKATITLPQVTNIQDCSQNVSVSITSSFGNGYGPFPNVNPGNYTANYVISDGCGNSGTCSISILVKDDKKPTPYCKNGLVIELMQTGMVTTWASDFDAGSSDNCGPVILSFSPNVNNTSATFDCDDLGQQPIELWVTDASGNQDFCTTFLIVQDNMGFCGSNPLFAGVGGAITNEMGFNVQAVHVNLNDPLSQSAMTDASGNFGFSAVPLGGDYTVAPAKDTNLVNGVSTFDIVVIRRHILNMDTLDSPYKIIAADANHSNSVTTFDIVEIQKAVLHITNKFANNQSWRFVDASYVFPDPLNPFQEPFPEVYNINDFAGNMTAVDFIAIKIGDVNGNAAPNDFDAPAEERSGETLQLPVRDEALKAGQAQRVDFTVKNFRDIVGYQFTLRFDTELLDFQQVEMGELASLSEANFGFRLLDEGVLTTSWNDIMPTNLPDDAVLFSLTFSARENANLSEALRISSDFTRAEAYFENGELLDVALKFEGSPLTPHSSSLKISPNPFSESTAIGFTLSEAQEATLTVFDAAGRLMKTQQGSFAVGYNELKINRLDLLAAGTYFFRLQTAGEAVTGKLVLVE